MMVKFSYLKIICFLHPIYSCCHLETIGDIFKECAKIDCFFFNEINYMRLINHNENEAENEK